MRDSGSFPAWDDDGFEYTLVWSRTPPRRAPPAAGGAGGFLPPRPALRTSVGEAVTWLGHGRYQIKETGRLLTSDSPQAV